MSTFKTSYSTVTILGMLNQFHSLANMAYAPQLNTTINAKRNVLNTVVPATGVTPSIKYFGIGINGYFNLDTGTLCQPYKPAATDMDLYTPIPFRVVPIDDDLTDVERQQYRMRVRTTFGGTEYYCYWLKMISYPDNSVLVNSVNSMNEQTAYNFDPLQLNPTPVRNLTPDVINANANRIAVSIAGDCLVTGTEVVEAINALYAGDVRQARISEWGFYTGIEQPTTSGDANGTPISYTEAAYVQLAAHRCTMGQDLSDLTATHTERMLFRDSNLVLL